MKEAYTTISKHENLHFDNEHDIHMSSKNYEKSRYGCDTNSPTNDLVLMESLCQILGEVG